MSRRRLELNRQAQQRWPAFYQFVGGYFHEDWLEMHGTPEAALDTAVREYPLQLRQQILREWRDWNSTVGATDDVRSLLNDGLGVCVLLKTPLQARNFANLLYDKLITSVREETSGNWKP